jgi:hypothetical protein
MLDELRIEVGMMLMLPAASRTLNFQQKITITYVHVRWYSGMSLAQQQ